MILEIIITLAIVGCLMIGPGGIIILLITITLLVLGLKSKGEDNESHETSSSADILPEEPEEIEDSNIVSADEIEPGNKLNSVKKYFANGGN